MLDLLFGVEIKNGLENIHGEYVCFIDSDDFVEKIIFKITL